jgi:PTS system fructose-specific IIC component/PTS system nitrogen regulatory IIA component
MKIDLEAEDKDEVFEEMVNKFCEARKSGVREEILEALWERESKMSTGIQKGIAIPHAKTTAIEGIHGVLGISKKGIEYDALDGQPVYLVFMLIASLTDSEMHLRLLKRLAELLNNHQFYEDLQIQNDPRGAS